MNDKNKLLAGHTLFAQLKEEDIGEIAKLFRLVPNAFITFNTIVQ